MNNKIINIADYVNVVIKYMRTMYLDYLVEHKEFYHNVFFIGLKGLLPILSISLIVFIFAAYVVESGIPNYETIDTYVEVQIKFIKMYIQRFIKIIIFSIWAGYIIIPFTQNIITKAYDTTIEECAKMEDITATDIEMETFDQNDFEDIRDLLVEQLENIHNANTHLQDVVTLAVIIDLAIGLIGLFGILYLILAIEKYICTYTNKRYKKFKYVL